MKEILTRNLGLKIVSVVIAFFVWLAVVNVSNPPVSRSREIPLEIQNANVLEKGGLAYELDTKKSTVTVTYEVHSLEQGSVSSADFKAYINLADYYPATGTVPVNVEVLNGKDYLVESVTVRPAVIRVKTEQIQQKDFDLLTNPIGKQADSYEIDRIDLNPKIVTLKGPESVIGRINAVGVEIEIEGINAQKSGTVVPVFYDANGNKLSLDERVSINVSEIAYTVHVMKVKQIPLEFEVGGQAADGYRYLGMEASANMVSAIGTESVIAAVPVIHIPADVLNLDGATQDRVIEVDVEEFLPDKENISIPWNSQVTVVLKVEKLEQKTVNLSTNRIIEEGEMDDYLYEYSRDSIELTLEGLKEDLEPIEASDLIVEMDVSRMTPGVHRGELIVEGLENVELVGYSDFQVTVSLKENDPGGTSAEESSPEEIPASSGQISHPRGDGQQEETQGTNAAPLGGQNEETAARSGEGMAQQQTSGSSAEETKENSIEETKGDGHAAIW